MSICGTSCGLIGKFPRSDVSRGVKLSTKGGSGKGLCILQLESKCVTSNRCLLYVRHYCRRDFRLPGGQQLRRHITHASGARSALVGEEASDGTENSKGLEKWVIAAEQTFNVAATEAVVKILETLYSKRLYARFYVLETIARVPYFAFVSVLHMYESFGWWRRADYLKIHFAQSWNELHHLLVMEALGGDERWMDRFLAQHIAVIYYFLTSIMYTVSPRMAYHFSECVEKHAFLTYDKFLKSHGDELRKLPAPDVAIQYYTKGDRYMFDEFQTDVVPNTRRPKVENLYDVFVNIREDEAQHCRTMQACQTGTSLRSPHRDVALTEVANGGECVDKDCKECLLPPAECSGIVDCASTSSSYANRARRNSMQINAMAGNVQDP